MGFFQGGAGNICETMNIISRYIKLQPKKSWNIFHSEDVFTQELFVTHCSRQAG